MRLRTNFFLIIITIIQLMFDNSQTTVIDNVQLDELQMDEAFLTFNNTNYPEQIVCMYNLVVCEHCHFERLFSSIFPCNSSRTGKIDTRFPYDFQIEIDNENHTFLCRIDSYSFDEHGSYSLEVSRSSDDQVSCVIIETKDPGYYWTPVICAVLFLCCFILIVQLCHYIYNSQYIGRILTNIGHERLPSTTALRETDNIAVMTARTPSLLTNESIPDDLLGVRTSISELPLVGSTRASNNAIKITKVLPKRLRSLDTFRGFALMVMIFVNYGGGGYWFFNHSVWNGITLADLVFPWFVWMMGVSIVLAQRSLLKKKVTKLSICMKIIRRTIILFFLGLLLQGGFEKPSNIRILGVLQRLALCYMITAIIVLIFDEGEDEFQSFQFPIGDDVHQPLLTELKHTVLQFWPQWLIIFCITFIWLLLTFVWEFENCPRGYLGPGGKHWNGKYENCTGGFAGYLDRKILGNDHIYGSPTCKSIYNTKIPYDPEGLLGILSGTLLCYLGVQAAHSFVYSTRVRRVCTQWIISSIICAFLGLLLSNGGQSDSWIPINKNLWSLTFIFILASLAFLNLTILYLLVDVYQWFTGEPWLWLGMNSIVVYCGHEICSNRFPIQFQVNKTHANLLALHVYGVMWWVAIAGVMYYKKIFIAI